MTSSSLLDDLLSDLPKQAPGLIPKWHAIGHIAKVELQTCRTCDTQTPVLLGIFHIEVSQGITRFTRVDPVYPAPTMQPTEIIVTHVPYCAHCLTSINFTPV